MSAGGMWRNCDFHILFMSSRHKLLFLWSSFSSTLHGSRGWMFVTVLCLCHLLPVRRALIYLLPPASLQCMYLLFHSRFLPHCPRSKTVIEQELSLLSFVGSFLPRASPHQEVRMGGLAQGLKSLSCLRMVRESPDR